MADQPAKPLITLQTYWDGKTARDWQREHLCVSIAGAQASAGTASPSTPLPDAPFLQVLRLGGALLEGDGTLDDLRARISGTARPSEAVAKAACEILLRAGLAQPAGQTEGALAATTLLADLDAALTAGDLDGADRIWELQYEPYAELIVALRRRERIAYDELPELLRPVVGGKPGRRACEHLAQMAILLGQAWPTAGGIRDGSGRIQDEDAAAREVERLFEEHAHGGLLGIDRLLPLLCEAQRMSPWAAAHQLRQLSMSGKLPRLGLSPSLGPGVLPREAVPVVHGPLGDVREEEIPFDRLKLGDRLIYSVTRSPG
ncbi:MAG TPA: hypothetical protein VLS89_12580 [Candidatus Nanopelagicales bacterium]|nr:hypothetical protein [Candidatus Nanopelagicales bacterium]